MTDIIGYGKSVQVIVYCDKQNQMCDYSDIFHFMPLCECIGKCNIVLSKKQRQKYNIDEVPFYLDKTTTAQSGEGSIFVFKTTIVKT